MQSFIFHKDMQIDGFVYINTQTVISEEQMKPNVL